MEILEKKTNSRGVTYALATVNYNVFAVYKLCENYNGKIKGGIAKAWRYVQKDLPLDKAMALFATRTK